MRDTVFQMNLLLRRLKKCHEDLKEICQNSNLHAESSINFKPIALATQAHQHLLERTMFNFINYVKVKWSI